MVMEWKSFEGGEEYGLDPESGFILCRSTPEDVLDGWLEDFIQEHSGHVSTRHGLPLQIRGGYAWRTVGRPRTISKHLEDYGDDLRRACSETGADLLTLVAIQYVESGLGDDFYALRYEPKFDGWRPRPGYDPDRWHSNGFNQIRTLESKEAAEKLGLKFVDVYGEPRPYHPSDGANPRTQALLAARHLCDLAGRFGTDPLRLSVAWNTGGVRKDINTRFRFYSHGKDGRIAKTIAAYNDAVVVLHGDNLRAKGLLE